MIKRALDLCLAAVALVLLAPVFLVVALLVKLGSKGPVFFRQERMGRHFQPFVIYKFRTMTDAPASARIALGDESRVTRIGRLLRQTKVDEWPQLFNILRGDMSFVGPRPEVRQFVDLFRDDYAQILTMRPGMTDLASIKYRNEADVLKASGSPENEYVTRILPDKIRLARDYQRRASLLFDLALMAQTAWHVVGGHAAESEEPGERAAASQGEGVLVDALLMFPREFRRAMVILVNLGLAILSTYFAFLLRFDGAIPSEILSMFLGTLPWLVVARGSTFFLFRLNEGMWRYVGLWDLRRIAAAVAVSTAVFYLCVRYGYGTDDYPRAVFLIDAALLLILMGTFRLSPRLYREIMRPPGKRRLLILGAGDMGERALRRLQHDQASSYAPVGFVDDNLSKIGQRIHGVPVLGGVNDLPAIVARLKPQEITMAVANPRPGLMRELVTLLEPYHVPLTAIVEGKDNGKDGATHVRNLSIEDLLSRPPVGLDVNQVRDLITGRRVLVTGAGGSIGSELCRQIAALDPASLVLFERYENGLYAIATALQDTQYHFVHPVVGDVTDAGRLEAVFCEHRPEIVFHAAAHKHVPLMEGSPCEAVKNNVTGTRLVAEASRRHDVDRFILISTDKAVNPSSVMGASKRVAELVIRQLSLRSATRFVTVRFGNVLGSNGSVLPRFQEQIKAGGPVTVTHPDITRYFMLIPEAVQLVLHAAAAGDGGNTLVLDMGDQIRVLDFARNLIRLSGHTPDEEIPIVFTGLRPGEKLYEELAGDDEIIDAGPVDKIQRVVSTVPHPGGIEDDLRELERQAAQGDTDAVMALLRVLVPTFRLSRPALTSATTTTSV